MKIALKRTLLCFVASAVLVGTSASLADTLVAKQRIDEQQVSQMLDYEILLLRAEIALKSDDHQAFDDYMQQLDRYIAPEKFRTRLETLRLQWQMKTDDQVDLRVKFEEAVDAESVVILLPLSGSYSEAGHAMLEPIEKGLANRKTFVIDTHLYEDMDELWNLVKLFDPELIIGPLLKNKAQAIADRNQKIPMLLFTSIARIEKNTPHILSMASSAETYYKALQPLFEDVAYEEIAWLTDRSDVSIDLVSLVDQTLQAYGDPLSEGRAKAYSPFLLETQTLSGGVDKTLAKLMGAEESLGRKNWLQRTLGRSLEFEHYARRDKRFLMVLTAQNYAIQVRPLVDYLHLNMKVIWLPVDLPDPKKFQSSLSNWHDTYVLMPRFFIYQNAKFLQSEAEKEKVGLFHALGDLAVHLIRLSKQPRPFRVRHELDEIEIGNDGRYYLKPKMFKLDRDKMSSETLQKVVQ